MAIYDYQGNKIYSDSDVSEPQENDIPIVTITGSLPSSKNDGEVNVILTYHSLTDEFESHATVKVQGDSSALYPKKNFTIKLYSDSNRTLKLKKQFRNWDKKRSKFVLKANWIDHSHARNIVNARLWSQIMKSRSDFNTLPNELKNGNLAIDGFPVKIFNNGVYMGLYTWNLPKDSLYGIDDTISTNAIIQGNSVDYSGSILWRSSSIDAKWTDETRNDSTPTGLIGNGFTTLLNFVYTSSDSTFASDFNNYCDKLSVIDQYILLYVGCIVDNIGKNQTFFTYDARKWYGGMYDMDGTWGLPPWNITGWKSATTVFQDDYSAVAEGDGHTTNLLYDRVGNLFASDIVSRYTALRETVLSADNINSEFEKFTCHIPPYLYDEDFASTTGGGNFTGIPLKDTNNILQIRQFVIDRLAYVDSQILT